MTAQKDAVKKVFSKQGLKFRNFEILKKDEESLGIIFTYLMLETILLGKFLQDSSIIEGFFAAIVPKITRSIEFDK